jgi:hypothetical protein
MSKKVTIMYGMMRLIAVADAMESHHWQNFKRGYPQYQQIRNEVNQILSQASIKKLKGLDEEVEID